MGAGREPVSRGGLEGPGQSLAGVYPFLVPGVEGGRVSSLTLRPRKGMWGSSRISTFRDRKFRSSRGDAACKCVSFVAAYPGCHPHWATSPHLSPPTSILHPWHHPVHAGVLSVTSIKCALGVCMSNFYPFAFSCLHLHPCPHGQPTFEMFFNL